MKKISQHTSYLAYRLYHGMASLVHYNGQPLCAIYNDVPDRCTYGDPITQGGTLAFNLVRSNGKFIGHSFVEKQANDQGIFLRSGGLCNSGGITSYLKIESWQFMRAWSQGHRCGEAGLDNINGKPTGVVRVSLGAMTTMRDVDIFLSFLETEYVETERVLQLARFDELNVHWGLETTVSHESGIGPSTDVSRRQNVVPSPQLRPFTSYPNIGTMRATPAPLSRRTFYEQRPGTVTSTVDLSRASMMSQRRPDTARNLVPLDSMRHYNNFDRNMRVSPTTQVFEMGPTPTVNKKKNGGFMNFLRGRKSSQPKVE